jgi:hypothetical protein
MRVCCMISRSWTFGALVALACSRPATKEHSASREPKRAAPKEQENPKPPAPAPAKPVATAAAETVTAEPPDAAGAGDGGPVATTDDEVICAPPKEIIASAIRALTTGFGLTSVEPQYVELGDLNGDGRVEPAGYYRDDAFSFSWILTEVREGCFRPVMDTASGVLTKALKRSTRGWRDLELDARLNGLAGPAVACQATFVAQFDGTRYGLARVVSAKPAQKNADISAAECRKQAKEIVEGE